MNTFQKQKEKWKEIQTSDFIRTPSNLIEKFGKERIADTANYLDLVNNKEEINLIINNLKSFEEIYEVFIYIVEKYPNDSNSYFIANKKKTENYLKHLSNLLCEKCKLEKRNTIVAVFPLNEIL